MSNAILARTNVPQTVFDSPTSGIKHKTHVAGSVAVGAAVATVGSGIAWTLLDGEVSRGGQNASALIFGAGIGLIAAGSTALTTKANYDDKSHTALKWGVGAAVVSALAVGLPISRGGGIGTVWGGARCWAPS